MTENAGFKKDVNLSNMVKILCFEFLCLSKDTPAITIQKSGKDKRTWPKPSKPLSNKNVLVFFFSFIKLRFLIHIYLKEQLPQVRNIWKPLVSKKRKDSQTCWSNNIHAIVIRSEHYTSKNIFHGELSQLILRKPKPHYRRDHLLWIQQLLTGFWQAHGALLIQEKRMTRCLGWWSWHYSGWVRTQICNETMVNIILIR